MTTKAFVIFGVLLTCVFSGCDQSQAASIKTSPQTITPRADEADTGKEPAAKTMQEFDSDALSPVHQLDTRMPPTIIFHAAFDDLVRYRTAVALHNRLESTGNKCDLVTVPVGGHSFTSEYKHWKTKVNNKLAAMLTREGLLPALE